MSDTGEEQYEIENEGDRVDAFGQLPDCVIHHILSFIPTTDVVKTSVLSKRWNNLCTSIPNLDFDDALFFASKMEGRNPPDENCFINFVDRVLLLRDASELDRFRLSCRVCFYASRMHSWISAAIVRNVHDLDLCLFMEDPFVLPLALFSCASLTRLKIEMNCVLELPNFIRFRNLKTLHLSLVTFLDDESTQNLLSGCPVLEELVMVDCEWTNLKNITIASSTLKRLTLDDLPYLGPPDSPSICKITINTSNLIYLKYIGYLANEIYLNDVSSLVKAFISVLTPHKRQKEVASHFVNLLRGLRNVASLSVSNLTIESFLFANNMLGPLPVLRKLTHLEVRMEIRHLTFRGLLKLLICCPNLQSLYIAEGFMHDICLSEHNLIWSSLRLCNIGSIKTLTFKNFQGYDSEICFIKCILWHGLVSNRLNISFSEDLLDDPDRQKVVKNALETIPWGCRSCVLTFS